MRSAAKRRAPADPTRVLLIICFGVSSRSLPRGQLTTRTPQPLRAMALTAFPLVSGARLLRSLFLASLIMLVVSPSVVCAAEPATLSGSINNSATGNLLQGARVELPALGLSALADNTGRYVLAGVPAGTHEVVVTYTGLDPVRSQLTVGAGQRAVRRCVHRPLQAKRCRSECHRHGPGDRL